MPRRRTRRAPSSGTWWPRSIGLAAALEAADHRLRTAEKATAREEYLQASQLATTDGGARRGDGCVGTHDRPHQPDRAPGRSGGLPGTAAGQPPRGSAAWRRTRGADGAHPGRGRRGRLPRRPGPPGGLRGAPREPGTRRPAQRPRSPRRHGRPRRGPERDAGRGAARHRGPGRRRPAGPRAAPRQPSRSTAASARPRRDCSSRSWSTPSCRRPARRAT